MERKNQKKSPSGNKFVPKPKKLGLQKTSVTIPRNKFSYALLGDQFHVSLRYSGTFNQNVAGFGNTNFGVAGVGTSIPKYWNEIFRIYKYAYLESVAFQFQITETNNRPMRVVVAESNTQDVLPTSYLELAETPRSVQKLVISGGNQAVVNIRHKTSARAIMGHTLEDDDTYWSTVGAGPTASLQPLLVLGYEPVIPASVCNMSYQLTITYCIKYFTLNHL